MINNAITSKYKKTRMNIKKQINIDGKRILKSKELLNQMEKNGENNSFIALKDHIFFLTIIQPYHNSSKKRIVTY